MISRVHRELGTAGFVIAIIALIAALGGGAYAASGGLSGKEKKQVRNIAKQEAKKVAKKGPQGSAGATGAQGVPGPQGTPGAAGGQGPKGDKGEKGDDGDKGDAGESVTIIPLDPGNANCAEGGAKFLNDSAEAFACNATSGIGGGYPETLPEGRTMSGVWEAQGENGYLIEAGDSYALVTISFPLPLAEAPTETVVVAETPTPAEEAKCPGSQIEPGAAPGILCLFKIFGDQPTQEVGGAFTFGATLGFNETDEGYGSWAVTAPAE